MTNPTWLPRKVSAARAARFTKWAAAGLFICALAAVGAPPAPAQSFDIVAEHNRRAVALVERGEHEEAVTEWREALRTAPENVPIHLNLGIVLMKIGRLDEAEEVLLDAVRLDPRRPKAHLLLGRAYLDQGKGCRGYDGGEGADEKTGGRPFREPSGAGSRNLAGKPCGIGHAGPLGEGYITGLVYGQPSAPGVVGCFKDFT